MKVKGGSTRAAPRATGVVVRHYGENSRMSDGAYMHAGSLFSWRVAFLEKEKGVGVCCMHVRILSIRVTVCI